MDMPRYFPHYFMSFFFFCSFSFGCGKSVLNWFRTSILCWECMFSYSLKYNSPRILGLVVCYLLLGNQPNVFFTVFLENVFYQLLSPRLGDSKVLKTTSIWMLYNNYISITIIIICLWFLKLYVGLPVLF